MRTYSVRTVRIVHKNIGTRVRANLHTLTHTYSHLHTHTHTHVHTHTHTHTNTHIHTSAHIYTHTHMHTHTYTQPSVENPHRSIDFAFRVNEYLSMCVHTYVYLYIYIYLCIYIFSHIYIYICIYIDTHSFLIFLRRRNKSFGRESLSGGSLLCRLSFTSDAR